MNTSKQRQHCGSPGRSLSRRHFLASCGGTAALVCLRFSSVETAASGAPLRAAIIGHTGRGNYGHDHDVIFNGRNDVEVVAVADPDEAGRARATQRSHALRGYADYREMLAKEKPELVCVTPRWTDQHHAMAMAALQGGAHVYLEKPITQTLAEADAMLTLAKASGRKIVVAHQMRLAPNVLYLKARLDATIGDLLEIRAHGKQDRRAGGEDMVVLGVHLFDLMRFFAGDPLWCSARVLQNGRDITTLDAHPASENIGPVAGDEITAEFAFEKGVQGRFVSRGRNREAAGPWGLELIGSKGAVRIMTEMIPTIYQLDSGASDGSKPRAWSIWKEDPTLNFSAAERGFGPANGRVLEDWLEAIRLDRQPVCSGYAAMKALEMVMAVFAAGLSRNRVRFPLAKRAHPLAGR